jgi:cytochrome P450
MSETITKVASPAHRLPPGPRGGWFLGSTFAFMRDQLGFLRNAVAEHGEFVRLSLGNAWCYLLVNPDHIDQVLRASADDFRKDRLTRWLIPLVGQGLLTSEGSFWRRQRKLAQPGFQRREIERYAAVMVEHTERMLETWRVGESRDTHEDMMNLTLSIVAKTLFDAELGDEARTIGESLDIVLDFFMSPWRYFQIRERLPLPSTLRYRRAIARIDAIIYGIITRRMESGEDPGDLLSRLLAACDDEGGHMTKKQLRDESVTLILAGHETTALVLFYTFALLARNPQAEESLARELSSVLGDRSPTAADVPRLRFTEWVIRESMRLYPPAWMIAREALVDCEIGGYHVPRGTQILMSQWVVQRDPRWFPDPESFRPERWDHDLIKQLPRCAYFPFGDGPRVCIGNHFAMMEAILILATIARRFRLTTDDTAPFAVIPTVTLRPARKSPMRVETRTGEAFDRRN